MEQTNLSKGLRIGTGVVAAVVVAGSILGFLGKLPVNLPAGAWIGAGAAGVAAGAGAGVLTQVKKKTTVEPNAGRATEVGTEPLLRPTGAAGAQ